MAKKKPVGSFVLCVNNEGFPASLELRKVYQSIPDAEAESHRMLRVIDESGEEIGRAHV